MAFGKKKEKTAAELEKELEKAKAAELAKVEQAKPTSVIDTGQEVETAPQPTAAEIKEIQDNVKYFQDNYMGLFDGGDMSQIQSLLFGILIEVKKARTKD